MIVNLITFYAQEFVKSWLNRGASLDDVIGRADLLGQVSRGSDHLDDLDLNPLLIKVGLTASTMIVIVHAMRFLIHWTPKSLGCCAFPKRW